MGTKIDEKIEYVNRIAPTHDRLSCNDINLYNGAYGIDDFGGQGKCYRCTLLTVAYTGEGIDDKPNLHDV